MNEQNLNSNKQGGDNRDIQGEDEEENKEEQINRNNQMINNKEKSNQLYSEDNEDIGHYIYKQNEKNLFAMKPKKMEDSLSLKASSQQQQQ